MVVAAEVVRGEVVVVGAGAAVVVGAGEDVCEGTTGCSGRGYDVVARLGLAGARSSSGSGSAVGSAGDGTTEVACGTGT